MKRAFTVLFIVSMMLPSVGCGLWYNPYLYPGQGPYAAPIYDGPAYDRAVYDGPVYDGPQHAAYQGPCEGPACGPPHPPWFPLLHWLGHCAGCGEVYWGDWPHPWDILSPCDRCGNFIGPNQVYPGQPWYDHAVVPHPSAPQPIEHLGSGPILERRAVGGEFDGYESGGYETDEVVGPEFFPSEADHASAIPPTHPSWRPSRRRQAVARAAHSRLR